MQESFPDLLWGWSRGGRLLYSKGECGRLLIWLIVSVLSASPSRILCVSVLRKWVRKFGYLQSRFQGLWTSPDILGESAPLFKSGESSWGTDLLGISLRARVVWGRLCPASEQAAGSTGPCSAGVTH